MQYSADGTEKEKELSNYRIPNKFSDIYQNNIVLQQIYISFMAHDCHQVCHKRIYLLTDPLSLMQWTAVSMALSLGYLDLWIVK